MLGYDVLIHNWIIIWLIILLWSIDNLLLIKFSLIAIRSTLLIVFALKYFTLQGASTVSWICPVCVFVDNNIFTHVYHFLPYLAAPEGRYSLTGVNIYLWLVNVLSKSCEHCCCQQVCSASIKAERMDGCHFACSKTPSSNGLSKMFRSLRWQTVLLHCINTTLKLLFTSIPLPFNHL